MLQNKYKERKAQIIEEAIEWQKNFNNTNCSYSELAYFWDYFSKMAKRYGCIKEFKDNGII